mgnify:CR=1 FL=1
MVSLSAWSTDQEHSVQPAPVTRRDPSRCVVRWQIRCDQPRPAGGKEVAWVVDTGGKLEVTSTPNQDNPLMDGKRVLLGNDVWEHAYYLKYQNKRPDYIQAWWNTINWSAVDARFTAAR